MTCEALHPIERPASELALPSELMPSEFLECADPTEGSPIAHVLTAVRQPEH